MTVQQDRSSLTVISSYLRHKLLSNAEGLTLIVSSAPKPCTPCDDFKEHHDIWGCIQSSARGSALIDFARDLNVVDFNDDSSAFLNETSIST